VFGVGAATRIYVAPGATDMRKSFNGLHGLVRDRLECDPMSGHVFLFSNAQHNRLKILFWDAVGYGSAQNVLRRAAFTGPRQTVRRTRLC
jgi:transposase